ncbi:MAG TPA: hypothetical protein VMB21_19055 [Candidatus Limnocylindria bacterium]|jgi:hypothetical protein|nr:hypothetical protein [Candidatus Limnocylindria bacterium]
MQKVQVIDSAENCIFDMFEATEDEFCLRFPPGHDIAFVDEVFCRNRGKRKALQNVLQHLWKRRIPKTQAAGIHGLLFFQLPQKKKAHYPTRRDEEARNPDGSYCRPAIRDS